MEIPIDVDTLQKLQKLSDRWGISVPTLAERVLFLGIDYWLADLRQPSTEEISKILNNPKSTGCSRPDEDTSRSTAQVPPRRRRQA